MDQIKKLQKIFSEHKQLHLWVVEYGITHEAITFALHKGVFPERIEVTCVGCNYFSGKLKGGPYSLDILQNRENKKEIIITGNISELLINLEFIAGIKHIHGGF